MILPTSILDMIEEANDYYFPTLTGMYLKISRTLITIATVFFTPLYLLYMQNPQWLPDVFSFVMVVIRSIFPSVWQFLLLELSIDGFQKEVNRAKTERIKDYTLKELTADYQRKPQSLAEVDSEAAFI